MITLNENQLKLIQYVSSLVFQKGEELGLTAIELAAVLGLIQVDWVCQIQTTLKQPPQQSKDQGHSPDSGGNNDSGSGDADVIPETGFVGRIVRDEDGDDNEQIQ